MDDVVGAIHVCLPSGVEMLRRSFQPNQRALHARLR